MGNLLKVIVVTIGIFMLAVFLAPMVLGGYILTMAGRSPQMAGAVGTAVVLSDPSLQRKITERAIESIPQTVNAPRAVTPPAPVEITEPVDQSRAGDTGTHSPFTTPSVQHHTTGELGEPMMEPTPSR